MEHETQYETDYHDLKVEREEVFAVRKRDHHSATHFVHEFMNWFSGVSAAVSLSPLVLSWLDVGKVKEVRDKLENNRGCCVVIENTGHSFSTIPKGNHFPSLDENHSVQPGPTYGIAGLVSHILSKTPAVGYHLATGELPEGMKDVLRKIPKIRGRDVGGQVAELRLFNALTAGGIIILGELSGHAMQKWEKERAAEKARSNGEDEDKAKEKAGQIGRAVALGTKGMGLFIALPTLLGGVGHAIQVTSATFGAGNVSDISNPEGFASHVMAFLGKPVGECGGELKAPSSAAAAGVVGLCCAIPAALSAVALLTGGGHSKKHSVSNAVNTATIKEPKDVSLIQDDLGSVIKYHHSIPWDRFEAETEEVAKRLEKAEKDAAKSERVAKAAKWAIRIAGVTATAAAGGLFLKHYAGKFAPVSENGAESGGQTDSASPEAKTKGTFIVKPNQTGATQDASYHPQSGADNPDEIMVRRPRGGMSGCCDNPTTGCCGDLAKTYIRKDLLSSLLGKTSNTEINPSVLRNRTLAFAAVASAAIGGSFVLANRVEKAIIAKRREKVEELKTRHDVARGIIAHMERDGHVSAGMAIG